MTTDPEALKMDILLSFRGEGYNLLDTEDPAVLGMPLGKGYSLLASVREEWMITFNDGVETSRYPLDSPKVPFTNAKDAIKLYDKFNDKFIEACKAAGINGEGEVHADTCIEPQETVEQESETVTRACNYDIDSVILKLDALVRGVRV